MMIKMLLQLSIWPMMIRKKMMMQPIIRKLRRLTHSRRRRSYKMVIKLIPVPSTGKTTQLLWLMIGDLSTILNTLALIREMTPH